MSHDPLSSYLVHDTKRHASVSPEGLELMGKEAANMFLDQGVPLNEGIAKLAGAHADINQEQVKRVCEFANTAVYLARHGQNKTAGAASSYPQFELADPNAVIQDLSDGARPTVITRTDVDYGTQPLRTKTSSAEDDALLADMFKTASVDEPSETALHDVIATKNQLVGMRDHLTNAGQRFDSLRKEASEGYYSLVKQHLLSGGGFEDVMVSARASGADERHIGETLQPFVARLMQEKVASPDRLKAGVRNLEKVAHRVLNQEHPLVKEFSLILALDEEMEKTATALTEVKENLDAVDDFIKETCRGATR